VWDVSTCSRVEPRAAAVDDRKPSCTLPRRSAGLHAARARRRWTRVVNDASALPLLLGTAVMIAAVHTAVGVDHTLPFIALGRAQRWSLRKLLTVTALCGVGHVLSSVVLGMIGIALGTALERLRWFESARGS